MIEDKPDPPHLRFLKEAADKHKPDRTLNTVNIAGLVALALFAAMLTFFWTHPNYMPPCVSGHRAWCATLMLPAPAPPLAPSTTRSSAGGPPPAASRGR